MSAPCELQTQSTTPAGRRRLQRASAALIRWASEAPTGKSRGRRTQDARQQRSDPTLGEGEVVRLPQPSNAIPTARELIGMVSGRSAAGNGGTVDAAAVDTSCDSLGRLGTRPELRDVVKELRKPVGGSGTFGRFLASFFPAAAPMHPTSAGSGSFRSRTRKAYSRAS
jgi:hypothetical protein